MSQLCKACSVYVARDPSGYCGVNVCLDAYEAGLGDGRKLELALRNVMRLALKMKTKRGVPDAAEHLLRFCREAGVVPSILRSDTLDAGGGGE